MNDLDVNLPLGTVPVKVGETVLAVDLSGGDVALRHQTLDCMPNVVLVQDA